MKQTPKVETKLCKYPYTAAELNQLGLDLAQALGSLRGVENEFDQVKAEYKSKITQAETRINSLEINRVNGFEMRQQRVTVKYLPEKREKHFFLEADEEQKTVVLVEPMTSDDFVVELLQSESKFDERIELPLFTQTNNDFGFLVVGTYKKYWFAALRVQVGNKQLNERLDSEQPSCKKRYDAVQRALKRYNDWLNDVLGKEAAKGFQDGIHSLLQSQKDL